MFQYTLANLLAENPGAVAAMFLDETGETVDLSCAELSPFQMRVAGAYLGISIRQLGELLASTDLGEAELVHIEKNDLHLFTTPLPDGYYLVLLQRPPAVVARSRASLLRARDEISREIFSV